MPPALIEFACAFEAYRRLGFSADDIFFGFQRGNVFATLRAQGKEFNIACGRLGGGEDALALYERLVKELPDWPTCEFLRAWESSIVGNHGVELVTGIQAKGIVLPCAIQKGMQ